MMDKDTELSLLCKIEELQRQNEILKQDNFYYKGRVEELERELRKISVMGE